MVNVGTLRASSGELAGMLGHKSVGICCLLETRFRGKSVKIISEKAAQYKLLWIENGKGFGAEGIFLTKDWAEEVINVCMVNDRMIVSKVFFKELLFHWSLISLFMLHNVV